MQCEIICIGDELLIGQVVNTNAAWMGRELTALGLEVRQVIAIPDQKDEIVEVIKRSLLRTQWIFITGGLGPTKDDLTKDALLSVFGGEMVFHEETWTQLGKLMARFGKTLTDSHRVQCELPSSATILSNLVGTAPGLLFETSHCKVCVMPGVPFEMEYIMQTHVIPLIRAGMTSGNIFYQTICTVGEGESVLSGRIADIEDSLPEHIGIAYLPSLGRVRIRVTGKGNNAERIASEVRKVTSDIVSRIAEFVFALEDIALAEALGRKLRESGKILSVAESCTGGFLGHLITANPNSSDYFIGGAITYSNALKQSLLGVKSKTLDQYGAVSEETAREMAIGAQATFKSDYAIAVTGIAGPSGGSDEKPLGTVWIAVASEDRVVTKRHTFGKDRLRNIELSAVYALDLLRKQIPASD